ncbi:MAG: hypothetical protein O9293_00470 [Porphyrobacter sp.]|nr:hypothetical protein [Porphyrobacter sp.]
MSRRAFPWSRLGIDPTKDKAAIRKAYADILRATNLDEDIAGYAELRRARDLALWQADQPDRDETPVLLEEVESELVGLGSLDDDDWDEDGWDGDDYVWDDSPAGQHPDPVTPVGPAPELTEAQQRAQAAWSRMLELLYPDGEKSDAAVTHEELDEGLAAMDVLIARAEEADLQEHDALDTALADLFARTWPRSAPFVEPANVAFHWLDEAGALEERYSLRFLNDRLKGMRFHEKVQMPAHPLNKAWVELSRPGRARFVDRLRIKRLEVHKLLTGIRQRYPELEVHLDPERVASWEVAAKDKNGPGSALVRILLVIFVVVVVLRGCLADMRDDDNGALVPSVLEQGPSAEEIDARVAEIFGKGTDMAAVDAADADSADALRPLLGMPDNKFLTPINYVRRQALGSAEIADANALAVRVDLKALWLTAARRKSAEACGAVVRGNFRDLDLGLTEKEKAREQALLRQLLSAKVLGHTPKEGETRYAIPGWLVEDTLKRSGLPEKRLVAALRDPKSADRCTVEIALVEAVRAAPSRVPDEVLKGL